MQNIFTNISNWGFDYVKIDFFPTDAYLSSDTVWNTSMSVVQAFELSLESMRVGMPAGHFMLNIFAWYLGDYGQSARYSFDMDADFSTLKDIAKETTVMSNILNQGTLMNDVDYLADGTISEYEGYGSVMSDATFKLWMDFTYATGSAQVLGMDFTGLGQNQTRLDLIKRIAAYPSSGIKPYIIDMTPTDYHIPAQAWLMPHSPNGNPNEYFLGLFNWDTAPATVTVNLTEYLPHGISYLTEFWSGANSFILPYRSSLSFSVGAYSSLAYIVRVPVLATAMSKQDDQHIKELSAYANNGWLHKMEFGFEQDDLDLIDTARFNGVDSYIIFTDITAYHMTETTVSMWVKMSSLTGSDYGTLIEKSYASGFEIQAYQKRLSVNARIGGTYYSEYLSQDNVFTDVNHWYKIAFTYNGTAGKLFVDGVKIQERTDVTGDLAVNTMPIYLGMRAGASLPFNGEIDNFRIYNYALTEQDITSEAATPVLRGIIVSWVDLYSNMAIGLVGVGFLLFGPCYLALGIRKGIDEDSMKRVMWCMIAVILGIGLVLAWLWR
jgi:hypothetical protein